MNQTKCEDSSVFGEQRDYNLTFIVELLGVEQNLPFSNRLHLT